MPRAQYDTLTRHRLLSIAGTWLLVGAVFLLSGCNVNPVAAIRHLTSSGPGGTAQIVVSGGLNGPLAIASSSTTRQMRCERQKSDPHSYSVLISGTISGQLYLLNIEIAGPPQQAGPPIGDYTGPGTYNQDHFHANFEAWPQAQGSPSWFSSTGTVTIGRDERSGSLDVQMGSITSPETLHVSGTWNLASACDILS